MSPHHRSRWIALTLSFCSAGCADLPLWNEQDETALSKLKRSQLGVGQRVPNIPETEAVGASSERILRGTSSFSRLVNCSRCPFVFKDEERTASDRMMTPRLHGALLRLSKLVNQTWPKLELRVTEAWDENREHGANSLHYEGRAADLTTSDQDPAKLGRLAALAVNAGLDWVFFEDETHVHVSVRR